MSVRDRAGFVAVPFTLRDNCAMGIPSEGDVRLRYVAVDGPIGVGRTSLVEMLARRFHGTKILEDVDNPFLGNFPQPANREARPQ